MSVAALSHLSHNCPKPKLFRKQPGNQILFPIKNLASTGHENKIIEIKQLLCNNLFSTPVWSRVMNPFLYSCTLSPLPKNPISPSARLLHV